MNRNMDSISQNRDVQIKVEPMSPNHSISAATASVTNVTGRLASFKPPRDLTLSGGANHLASYKLNNSSLSNNKKLFVPNVNIARRKGNSLSHASESAISSHKPVISKGRKPPRSKGNFVQTQGVFSEGLAPGKPREYSRHSGGDSQPHLEKPKLNLNKTINKKKEDSYVKDLLRDNFIDDPSILPDFNDCPKSLPLLLKVKNNSYKDLDSTFESLQVKTEKLESCKAEDLLSTTAELPQIFENSTSPRLMVFDFPDELRKPEERKRMKTDKHEKAVDAEAVTNSDNVAHRLCDIGEGFWGTLRILDDGSAYILVGQEKIPITLTRHCPKQNIMSVNLDTTASRGEIINLGAVTATLKCSSNFMFK